MTTAILGLDTSDPSSRKAHKVSESAGDVLYFSGPGALAVGGSSGSPLADLHTDILGLPPGGTAASDGDLITYDSGTSIDLYVGDFSYASGPKKLISMEDSFTGDVSGTPDATSVDKIQGYAVQDHAPVDGEVLQWVTANSQYEPATLVAGAHAIGGSSHDADSLADLNTKVSGGNLDFTTASRPPNGTASGDLSSSYPGPTVSKLNGYTIQTGAPTTRDMLMWSGTQWVHVSMLGSYSALSITTIYNPSEDGFVVCSVVTGGATSWSKVYGYAGASSNPTTMRACASASEWAGTDYPHRANSFMMPVRKGEYFKVIREEYGGTAPVINVWWVKLGNV